VAVAARPGTSGTIDRRDPRFCAASGASAAGVVMESMVTPGRRRSGTDTGFLTAPPICGPVDVIRVSCSA